MTADPDPRESLGGQVLVRRNRSERLLSILTPFRHVVIVSHVNPDPDSLASMLGLKALIESCQQGKPVILTVDGMIARAENRAMVELIPIPLAPVEAVHVDPGTAVIMVDTQPHTGRRASEAAAPQVVIDHHETGGDLNGVLFHDIRPHLGATSTMVTGYLLEQDVSVTPELATALLYGIESETSGYPARPARWMTARWSGCSPGPTRTCWPGSAIPSSPRATSPRSSTPWPTRSSIATWS